MQRITGADYRIFLQLSLSTLCCWFYTPAFYTVIRQWAGRRHTDKLDTVQRGSSQLPPGFVLQSKKLEANPIIFKRFTL